MRYIASNPAAELVLPSCENRLAERIVRGRRPADVGNG
jgi:hypothetical protein